MHASASSFMAPSNGDDGPTARPARTLEPSSEPQHTTHNTTTKIRVPNGTIGHIVSLLSSALLTSRTVSLAS